MKASRFGIVPVILLVCTFVFWSVPAKSGWLDNVKDATKKLQKAGEKVIELKDGPAAEQGAGVKQNKKKTERQKAKEKRAEQKKAKEKQKAELKKKRQAEQQKKLAEQKKKHDKHKAMHEEQEAKWQAEQDKKRAEEQNRKAEQDKKRAQQNKLFDSYTGPRRIDNANHVLLAVRFNTARYKIKKANIEYGEYHYLLKNLLQSRYPKEWQNIRNEFDMRRELPKLRQRLMEDIKNIPTTYRLVAAVSIGAYDFQRKGYSLGMPGIQTVLLDRRGTEAAFLSMSPDRAEQYKKDCAGSGKTCTLYVEVVYQVVNAEMVSATTHSAVLYARIKRLRIYKQGLSARGKETILSELLREVPVAQLGPSLNYETLAADDADIQDSEDNLHLSF